MTQYLTENVEWLPNNLPSPSGRGAGGEGNLLPSETPTIRLEGVSKAYRRGTVAAHVLCGVDLTVHRGECAYSGRALGQRQDHALVDSRLHPGGRRGFGETLRPRPCRAGAAQRTLLRRDRIGFVFQRFHLIRGLTALENVCVPMTLGGAPLRSARPRALGLLEAVGLGEKVHAHPRNLSAGQCQRVAIARALANDPDLVLADEPTASLDAKNGQEAMQLLRRLVTQEGKTAVVVTHDPRIFSFADQIHWLENGRIVERQSPLLDEPLEVGTVY